MTTNHLRRIFAAMLLLLALCGLGACTLHVIYIEHDLILCMLDYDLTLLIGFPYAQRITFRINSQ